MNFHESRRLEWSQSRVETAGLLVAALLGTLVAILNSSCPDPLGRQVWDKLESVDAVLFPRPCHGRIPNCVGSAMACPVPTGSNICNSLASGRSLVYPGRNLLEVPEMREASVVKVHPSIGAAALRTALVMAGKTVSCLRPSIGYILSSN